MRHRLTPSRRLRALAEPIERFVQANIALVLVQALIIRLSLELSTPEGEGPDTLVLLAMLAATVGAGILVALLRRVIGRFPRRDIRIAMALGSLALQALAFQLIHTYAS